MSAPEVEVVPVGNFPELVEDEGKAYECVICRKYDQDFKVLPCLHAVCGDERCLSMTIGEQFSCPVCLLKIEVDEDIINAPNPFKKHKDAVKISDQDLECNYCVRKGKAVGHCEECESYLCDSCFENHKLMRATQSHVVKTTLGDSKPDPDEKPNLKEFCTAHKTEKITALCLTCKVDICELCMKKVHLGHLFKRVETIVDELKHQFTNRLRTVEYIMNRCGEAEKELTHKITDLLQYEKSQLYTEAAAQMTLILSSIMAQENNIRQQLIENTIEKVEQLNLKRVKMHAYNKQGKQFVRYVSDLFDKGSTMSVYANRTNLQRRLSYLLKQSFILNPDKFITYTERDFHFSMDKSMTALCQKYIKDLAKISYVNLPSRGRSRLNKGTAPPPPVVPYVESSLPSPSPNNGNSLPSTKTGSRRKSAILPKTRGFGDLEFEDMEVVEISEPVRPAPAPNPPTRKGGFGILEHDSIVEAALKYNAEITGAAMMMSKELAASVKASMSKEGKIAKKVSLENSSKKVATTEEDKVEITLATEEPEKTSSEEEYLSAIIEPVEDDEVAEVKSVSREPYSEKKVGTGSGASQSAEKLKTIEVSSRGRALKRRIPSRSESVESSESGSKTPKEDRRKSPKSIAETTPVKKEHNSESPLNHPDSSPSESPQPSTSAAAMTGVVTGKRERKRKELPEFVVSPPPARKRKTETGRKSVKLRKSPHQTATALKKLKDKDPTGSKEEDEEIPLAEADDHQNEDYCGVCQRDDYEGPTKQETVMICCDGCPKVFHLRCHIPQLILIPKNENWYCMFCVSKADAIKFGTVTGEDAVNPDKGIDSCDWTEFFLACKLLCEIFKLEESSIAKNDLPELMPGSTKDRVYDLHFIRKRLTYREPSTFPTIESYLFSFKKMVRQLTQIFKKNESISNLTKLKALHSKISELATDYFPDVDYFTLASQSDAEEAE